MYFYGRTPVGIFGRSFIVTTEEIGGIISQKISQGNSMIVLQKIFTVSHRKFFGGVSESISKEIFVEIARRIAEAFPREIYEIFEQTSSVINSECFSVNSVIWCFKRLALK